ncbi:MAG: ATP-dependent sacrificial sulfur transferase LarE [Selenomonas sp.]|uniref:ATP-dependent sacrificial sulfur transferase LarE n=1 Tax=Selenomonas sp. TaxID=2053611 RepID=UPI0025EEFEC7|nr:ATP-dependent sacrificial sulfur transferase LarE [Selenomonas sp.]MCR5758393.1 ATP-dependent sacrificial sulfur transferase LarE [Selenomonas sp.]
MMNEELQRKVEKLQGLLKSYGQAAIAFSAGVDSTLLLKAAKEQLGKERVLALTIKSAFVPEEDIREGKAFCLTEGIRQKIIEIDPLVYYDVRTNPSHRCYFCKRLILGRLRELAGAENIVHLLDGTNLDDLQDYRPGNEAVKELGVISPLQEAGFTKADVRAFSQALGLKTADKPSAACLASRIPYGEELTADKLKRVEKAEVFLRDAGFQQLRVRSHGDIARVELLPADMERFMAAGFYGKTARKLKDLGFAYVTLDLEGYRMGSLNQVLKG